MKMSINCQFCKLTWHWKLKRERRNRHRPLLMWLYNIDQSPTPIAYPHLDYILIAKLQYLCQVDRSKYYYYCWLILDRRKIRRMWKFIKHHGTLSEMINNRVILFMEYLLPYHQTMLKVNQAKNRCCHPRSSFEYRNMRHNIKGPTLPVIKRLFWLYIYITFFLNVDKGLIYWWCLTQLRSVVCGTINKIVILRRKICLREFYIVIMDVIRE